jgi:hypothetical protein
MRYLTGIIISAAMIEDDPIRRVSLWAENTIKASDAFEDEKFKQIFGEDQKFNKDESVELAVDTAKKLKMRIHPQFIEQIINDMIIIGSASAACILNLSPAESIAVAFGSNYLEKKMPLTKKITEELFLDDNSLRYLATAQWGRIVRKNEE